MNWTNCRYMEGTPNMENTIAILKAIYTRVYVEQELDGLSTNRRPPALPVYNRILRRIH